LKTLASLVVLLLVCVACSGGAEGSPSASPADPTPTPEPSIDAVGGLVVVDCDPSTVDDCQIPGLLVVQPVPVGEQVRIRFRVRNVSDESVGPVTILVTDSALEADLNALLPIAGCSQPCEDTASDDGLELRAEFQAPIEAGKAVTYTLVLTAKEAAEHLLDVSIFASPMADIGSVPADDPTKIAEWLSVVVTVEEA
jgi:hypothetical protein